MNEQNEELDQVWENCLEMWKWIYENVKKEDDIEDIANLKIRWLKDNGHSNYRRNDCFFCQYASKNGGIFVAKTGNDTNHKYCPQCPGTLVSKQFHCEFKKSYVWYAKPKQFYKKLLKLYQKYQDNKE